MPDRRTDEHESSAAPLRSGGTDEPVAYLSDDGLWDITAHGNALWGFPWKEGRKAVYAAPVAAPAVLREDLPTRERVDNQVLDYARARENAFRIDATMYDRQEVNEEWTVLMAMLDALYAAVAEQADAKAAAAHQESEGGA